MTRQRKRAEDRKAELVATAIRLAGEVGPDRVTTQALAEAVGISQPAIFRHFPTKPDIWLAVGETITQGMEPGAPGLPTVDENDPLARLEALVARYLGQIMQTPAIPAILFSRELHSENEALRAHFQTVMTRRRAGFAALIAAAQDRGQIGGGRAEAGDLAAVILATIQGLAMRWSLEARGFDLQAEGVRLIGGVIRGFAGNRGAE
ncbi:TetR/AcrR family transcriptional regulator [Marimonas arenosa]|uniref:TetR/AcrR family transcriptional regulator n=1 Tax=Marimonas arenosa TaxID=1795305 RepID=A0AAE3WF63_9RHOB|nr:TetR/AcrR family transcriptional regulator [Marimonas arenosa]MDQ2091602.1 TetR/AcrR family transcriptional regulator [Marimonas arenosa]